jgi:hypothetical protein
MQGRGACKDVASGRERRRTVFETVQRLKGTRTIRHHIEGRTSKARRNWVAQWIRPLAVRVAATASLHSLHLSNARSVNLVLFLLVEERDHVRHGWYGHVLLDILEALLQLCLGQFHGFRDSFLLNLLLVILGIGLGHLLLM